ncbi:MULTISPECIES: aldehyde dehydrogenase family protein [Psychrilyobacter]|uniref:Aldehyde dehydrogenase family protein n=1 Tax=Psychrilyobacter piezotolerans TaxID=2293438 RepID=A0ABX9KFR6_9FUSO|nr:MULTISPECIES: aldehyde dehydrogenase family protein [Psychrilyobacter]MCS5422152.1 aldehyde dehydrogenase family protein [Psychrilyobacter sp. S5]NDI78444.1 aldehyde dehydrogenase family protein [Psychrilyobacter piezotolerans]RDE60628.1 aldehyde dehydrogenase family protein [Psychrilyobacter sp. S5]REI40555.1 aldehyde dehydrogenase family protein [Psychrilyobacter piezotolerans]
MDSKNYINNMIQKAKEAQKELATYTQEELDAIVKTIGKTVYDNAEELARMAVDETRMGVYEDKVGKNKGKSKNIWHNLKDKKSVGIIERDLEKNLIMVAKPVGIVGAVTPTTNPIVTPMCNAMFAIKGGNAIIVAPHPRSKACTAETVARINAALVENGIRCPKDAIQVIAEPSLAYTNELMEKVDVVLATGGMGMVKAAYSSGKPSFGVGAGNVQVIVDKGVNYDDAAAKIIAGRKFDNGIICSGEQTVIAPKSEYNEVIKAMVKNGAHYIDNPADIQKFRDAIFEDGHMNKDVVGQSVARVAEMAGVEVPKDAKVILLKASGIGAEDLLCKEKMCPVLSAFEYDTIEDAINIAQTNLDLEGKGHTAAIHSDNLENIELAGNLLTVSRLVVNAPSSTTAGGSMLNGFAPTTTLGCGTWGNNIISENLDYKHLINVSRIGLVRGDVIIPSDEQIWE